MRPSITGNRIDASSTLILVAGESVIVSGNTIDGAAPLITIEQPDEPGDRGDDA